MASSTVFFCKECGYESAKWLGKCPSCNSWNSFVSKEGLNIQVIDSIDNHIKFETFLLKQVK